MTETKRQRFCRIFPNRVETLLDQLRKVRNCSNRSNYEWTDEKVSRAWELIAEEFVATAAEYGVDIELKVLAK